MLSPLVRALALSSLFICGGKLWAETITVQRVLVTLKEQVDVPARQRGQILSLTVDGGQFVKAGDLLAKIDDGDARLVKQRAEISLLNARAEAQNTIKIRLAKKSIELAESELERGIASRRLFQNSVTEEEILRRRLVLDTARLDLEQAQHEYDLAQHQMKLSENELAIADRAMELYRIVAPIDGIVSEIEHRTGEWVEPGDRVVQIVSIDRLRAEGYLKAGHTRSNLAKSTVTVHAQLGDQKHAELNGTLEFVDSEVNPVDGMLRIWAEIENPDRLLLPGMHASMTIHAP